MYIFNIDLHQYASLSTNQHQSAPIRPISINQHITLDLWGIGRKVIAMINGTCIYILKHPQPDFSYKIHAEHGLTGAYTLQKPQQKTLKELSDKLTPTPTPNPRPQPNLILKLSSKQIAIGLFKVRLGQQITPCSVIQSVSHDCNNYLHLYLPPTLLPTKTITCVANNFENAILFANTWKYALQDTNCVIYQL